MNPCLLSIAEAGAAMRLGKLTAVALAQAQLARIEKHNPAIHAFVTVTVDQALAAAQKADADFAAGIDHGPMQGIGFAIKDIIDMAGLPTRCGSFNQPDTICGLDAEIVATLRAAGAVPLGKVATYEFALVGPNFDGPNPPPVNPWNTSHITGGSSSGSAAAVAAGMVRCAIGTDTGGSIRSPAAYCGVVGLKPTFGALSRKGVFPLAADLDTVGPVAASVGDAAIISNAMGVPSLSQIGYPVKGKRVAYARDWFANDAATDPAVLAAMDAAMSDFSLAGIEVELITLPDYAAMEAVGITVLQYQAYEVHRQNIAGGKYGKQALETILSGQNISAKQFKKARQEAHGFRNKIDAVLGNYDAVATANVLAPAPLLSDFSEDRAKWTPMRTLPFNVTGHPVLALPIGFSNGLPLGMQLIGPNRSESSLCQIGNTFERATDHSVLRPDL
jgi:aspartyl-tRNA(Asn)/glutamyl-tRNA(Gln) amidotransferase subunit A